ncbi:MAG: neuromedin U [Gammaproteobacteria bacterium]|jgi:hypothetical protein
MMTVFADDARSQQGDLAKASQNPISSLISVPFESNSNFDVGPGDDYANVLNIKPVVPVGFSENWNLVNRVILPVVYQDWSVGGDDGEWGTGNALYQGFFTPKNSGKYIWGVGPQIGIPTSSDRRFGPDKWAAGPAFVALTMPGRWVVGALVSQLWDIGGGRDGDADISQLTVQYFVNYNMDDGWYLTTAPVISANWDAHSDDRWVVPVGGGAGRIFKIGNQAINAKVAGYYNVEDSSGSGDWTFQASWTFLFPK